MIIPIRVFCVWSIYARVEYLAGCSYSHWAVTDCQDSPLTACCWGKEKTEPSTPWRLQWKTGHPEAQERLRRRRTDIKRKKNKISKDKHKLYCYEGMLLLVWRANVPMAVNKKKHRWLRAKRKMLCWGCKQPHFDTKNNPIWWRASYSGIKLLKCCLVRGASAFVLFNNQWFFHFKGKPDTIYSRVCRPTILDVTTQPCAIFIGASKGLNLTET